MQPLHGPMGRIAWAGGRRLLHRDAITVKFAATRRTMLLDIAYSQYHGNPFTKQPRSFSSLDTTKRTEPLQSSLNGTNVKSDASNQRRDEPSLPQSELPSVSESRRSDFTQKFSHVMDNVQARVLTASQTLNDITGYSAIEGIKKENETLEVQLADAHVKVRTARQAYKTSNTKRATTQREVTTLLARKDTWSPVDLERFTELYRIDHVLEAEVSAAQESLTEAEAEEQSLGQRLNAGILKRYHEEQIWSDRIRRASTWGTWGLMGMNFLLFVVLQFFAEPWRRRRLVQGVVEEEKRVLEEVRGELEAVKLALAERDEPAPQTSQSSVLMPMEPEVLPPTGPQCTWKEMFMDPSRWPDAAAYMYSEERIDLRMKDATTLALQGALTGAVIAGSAVVLFMRRT